MPLLGRSIHVGVEDLHVHPHAAVKAKVTSSGGGRARTQKQPAGLGPYTGTAAL